ncbi:MAG TPA: hypothetical protein VLQ48_15070 [Chloroflexia bacterium]|nr:hypothetical protein [Chloroflexia bacterium]
MTPELAQFSDWVLALLPRLFIYPGGLWLLAGVLLVRLAGGGATAIRPGVWLDDLLRTDLPSLALAWVVVALLPLPEASILPSPVDIWVLAALLALSLLLDVGLRNPQGLVIKQTGVAITLAVLAPLAAGDLPITAPNDYLNHAPLAFGLTMAAVVLGVVVILWLGCRGLAGQVRCLAWLGLALAPIYGDMWTISTVWIFGAAVIVALGARGFERIAGTPDDLRGWTRVILWLPACLALGALLLAAL